MLSFISACTNIQVSKNWPKEGVVKYEDVTLTYRENLPDALEEVSFETHAGEKLGIVGRTGAGKSSLFLALFRMVQINRGRISVDGIDIGLLHLKDLRSVQLSCAKMCT